jgi:predicted nucleic acid-binding protein
MIVVADTSPLNYLVLIDEAELLPRLFGTVVIPTAVLAELQDDETPSIVREWVAQHPVWLSIQPLSSNPDPGLDHLDRGEREAITLARELNADQLLLDEADARREAELRNLAFIGTLGVLRRASHFGWIDLPSALLRLQQTTFYVSPKLVRSLLDEDANRKTKAE